MMHVKLAFLCTFVGGAWAGRTVLAGSGQPESSCLDVNTASISAMKKLPGLGKTTAQSIVNGRCYRNAQHFEQKVKRMTGGAVMWVSLSKLLDSNNLCVVQPSEGECAEEQECVDVNTASLGQLTGLHGLGRGSAMKIIDGRCYADNDDFKKKVLVMDEGPAMWNNLAELLKSQQLCVVKDSNCSPAAPSPEEDGDEETDTSTPQDKVNVNAADLRTLMGVDSAERVGHAVALSIIEGRCYKDSDDFKQKILKTDKGKEKWTAIAPLVESGLLYVGLCFQLPSDIQPPAEPESKEKPMWTTYACGGLTMPPQRHVLRSVHPATVVKDMKYAIFNSLTSKWNFVQETPARRKECLDQFAPVPDKTAIGGYPISTDEATYKQSSGLCMLVKVKKFGVYEEVALEYSEFNTKRKMPNFVAYKVLDLPKKYNPEQCRNVKWNTICPQTKSGQQSKIPECQNLPIRSFRPSALQGKSCPSGADDACAAMVNTRGHMRPVSQSAWSQEVCGATMNYANVFPSRNDAKRHTFDAKSWAKRERQLMKYLGKVRSTSSTEPAALWVVVGTSRESDGKIESTQKDFIEVPSFLWTAVYDPQAKKATGWLCRNGLSRHDDCYCMDMLSITELESRVGHAIFPQLREQRGIDLTDGSHDNFYKDLYTLDKWD